MNIPFLEHFLSSLCTFVVVMPVIVLPLLCCCYFQAFYRQTLPLLGVILVGFGELASLCIHIFFSVSLFAVRTALGFVSFLGCKVNVMKSKL